MSSSATDARGATPTLLEVTIRELGEAWTMLVLGLRAGRHALQEGRFVEASRVLEEAAIKVASRFPERDDLILKAEEARVVAAAYAQDAAALSRACADYVRVMVDTPRRVRTLSGAVAFGDELVAAGKTVGGAALARCLELLLGESAASAYLAARLHDHHVAMLIGEQHPEDLVRAAAQASDAAYRRVEVLGSAPQAAHATIRRAALAMRLAEATKGRAQRAGDVERVNVFSLPPPLQLTYARLQCRSRRRLRRVRALDLLTSLATRREHRPMALELIRWWTRTLVPGIDPLEVDRLEGAFARLEPADAAAASDFLTLLGRYEELRDGAVDHLAWAEQLRERGSATTGPASGADQGAYDAVLAWLDGGSVPSPLLRGAPEPSGAALKALSVAREPTPAGVQGVVEAYDALGWERTEELRPLSALLPVLLGRWSELAAAQEAIGALVRRFTRCGPTPPYGALALAELCGQVGAHELAAECALRAARDAAASEERDVARVGAWVEAGAAAAVAAQRLAVARHLLARWRALQG